MHTLRKGYDSNFKFYETYEMSPLNFSISFVRQFFTFLNFNFCDIFNYFYGIHVKNYKYPTSTMDRVVKGKETTRHHVIVFCVNHTGSINCKALIICSELVKSFGL